MTEKGGNEFAVLLREGVLGTKRPCTRKMGSPGREVKHVCRGVLEGCTQIKALHYTEPSSLTARAASVCMALATGTIKDMPMRHLNFGQAHLMAEIDTEIYIGPHEENRVFPNTMGRLNKAIYGLV